MTSKREPTQVVSIRLPSSVAQWVEENGGSHFVRAYIYMLWHRETHKNRINFSEDLSQDEKLLPTL